MYRRKPSSTSTRHTIRKAVEGILLAFAIAWTASCQGVSAGPPVQQGSLFFGSLALNFGSIAPGVSKTLTVSVTNSGNAPVSISAAAISSKYFALTSPSLPAALAAGQSVSLTFSFTPNAAGTFDASATIASNASSAVPNLALTGTGVADGKLAPSATSEGFGSVIVGSSRSLTELITNTGGSSVSVSQVKISGAGFSFSGMSAPISLSAGQSASIDVSFAPTSSGGVSGSLTITSDATNPALSIVLSGTGTTTAGNLTVTPSTLGLGNVVVGSSGAASGTLTASGANVTVTAANTGNSVFSVGGLSLPITIPVGQSTSFSVTFSPQVAGSASASLSFTSNGQPATTTESLTGTGTPAPTHTVNLSWNASTSSNISGYNIYRAGYTTSCGSFSRINGVLNTGTLYTDSTVTNGSAYCYATTAVDSSSAESGYSNIVSNLKIPTQ
jgi:hypothetical protein